MKTTAIGTTGCFSVTFRRAGRQNTCYFRVPQLRGALGFGGSGADGKARAVAIAERADRLVAMWRGCAK